jgi:hypothetical protein
MNALAHLFSLPTANPQVGKTLPPLTLIGIHQAIDDKGQDRVLTHCTGFQAISAFAKEMPDRFMLNTAGTKYTITG